MTNAKSIKQTRKRKELEGYVRKEFWIKPEWLARIRAFLEKLG